MSGRPLTIPEELKTVASVLQVWFPGVEAGNAIAETVLGMSNPSGKLTATWPRNVGQIPIYHSQKITGRPQMGDEFQKFKSNYLDVENTPLLPFGYGLSYTKFTYGAPTLSRDTLSVGSDVRFTVSVTNSGRFDGEEVVQLYISDKKRSIAPPVKALKGFKKVFIEKEATQEVVFNLDRELFKFYNQDLMFVLEPGDFDLSVGTNSQNTQTLNLYVE
jgi:beta-glucosidase